MRFGAISLVSALLVATPSFAANQAKAVNDNDSPRFETLGWFDASIPNGLSDWNFQFNEPQAAANLSIWHFAEPGCRGFGINEVSVKSSADDAEWTRLDVNVFEGVAHFNATTEFSAVKMTFSNDRLLRANCRVSIEKANFMVPQIIDMLAKIDAPACIPDGGDTSDADNQACTYSLTRVDLPTRDLLSISEQDFLDFNLEAEAFYRLQGYMQSQDDGSISFVLTSATRVK